MKKRKQILSIFIIAAIIFATVFGSISMADITQLLPDIEGHWAQNTIEDMVNEEIIEGYPDGTFRPNKNITRAEFTSLLVRAFDLKPGPGKVFSDTANHWAEDYIKTANYHGLVNGYSDTLFGPDDPVTREQIAVMVVNATKVELLDESKTFTDSAQISVWAKEPVAKAAAAELIVGYPDGTFKPKANATRAEAAVILDRSMKIPTDGKITTFNIAGTYGPKDGIETIETNVTINADGIILRNTTIKGDLIISEKVGDGDVTLNNVTVEGTTSIYGGGKDSIHINGGQYNNIVIEGTPGGNIRIVAVDAKGIKIAVSENAVGEEIILEGTFESVEIKSNDIILSTRGKTDINEIKVHKNLSGTILNIDEGAIVKELVLDSATEVKNAKDTIKKIGGDKATDSNIVNPPKEEREPSSGGEPTLPSKKEIDKAGLQARVNEAKNYKFEDYTEESWMDFVSALTAAQDVLDNEKATQEDIDMVLASLNAAIIKLEEKSITYFDELWDSFANTINTQAQKTDPKEKLTVRFDAKNKHVNIKILDNYHTREITSIAFGTGLNTAVLNLLKSEKIIKINSAGYEVETLDENRNKKEDDDLQSEALDVAFAWLGDNDRKTPMEDYLIGETVDFVLHGSLNNEEFSVTYIIYFY